jgi:hypothetical protein
MAASPELLSEKLIQIVKSVPGKQKYLQDYQQLRTSNQIT